MREFKIVAWCDLCFKEGQAGDDALLPVQVEATQSWCVACVAGEDKRPGMKQLDLCERHGKPFAELAELLAGSDIAYVGAGARPAGKRPVAAPVAATRPPGRPPGKSTPDNARCPVCRLTVRYGSLTTHIWAKHRPGETKQPQPARCPECHERFEPQGMSLHRKMTHDVDPLIEVLKGVTGYTVTGREREEL